MAASLSLENSLSLELLRLEDALISVQEQRSRSETFIQIGLATCVQFERDFEQKNKTD